MTNCVRIAVHVPAKGEPRADRLDVGGEIKFRKPWAAARIEQSIANQRDDWRFGERAQFGDEV